MDENMKSCLKCKCQYEDEYSFCPKCGGKLVEDNHCPQCNRIIEKGYTFCPYCGCKIRDDDFNSVSSNIKQNIVGKKTTKVSDILYDMLVVGQNASVKDNFWIEFGFDGYPLYQSKLNILMDIHNVKKNFFLIEEFICMSAGIGIHKFLETCCPDDLDANKCIEKVIQLASNESCLEKVFQLNRPDVKKRFDFLISDYVLAFAFEFGTMNNARPQFTEIFMKHCQTNNIEGKSMYSGANYLVGYYLDYYRNKMKELESYEVINDITEFIRKAKPQEDNNGVSESDIEELFGWPKELGPEPDDYYDIKPKRRF